MLTMDCNTFMADREAERKRESGPLAHFYLAALPFNFLILFEVVLYRDLEPFHAANTLTVMVEIDVI